jgi:hypothetical protein
MPSRNMKAIASLIRLFGGAAISGVCDKEKLDATPVSSWPKYRRREHRGHSPHLKQNRAESAAFGSAAIVEIVVYGNGERI